MQIPDFSDFLDLVSSVALANVCLTLPILLHWKIFKPLPVWMYVLHVGIFLVSERNFAQMDGCITYSVWRFEMLLCCFLVYVFVVRSLEFSRAYLALFLPFCLSFVTYCQWTVHATWFHEDTASRPFDLWTFAQVLIFRIDFLNSRKRHSHNELSKRFSLEATSLS